MECVQRNEGVERFQRHVDGQVTRFKTQACDGVTALVGERRQPRYPLFGNGFQHVQVVPNAKGEKGVVKAFLAKVVEYLPYREPRLPIQPDATGANPTNGHQHVLQVGAIVGARRLHRIRSCTGRG